MAFSNFGIRVFCTALPLALGLLAFTSHAKMSETTASRSPTGSAPNHLRPVDSIKLSPEPPLGKAEETRILELIRNLAKIESPNFGISPTSSGSAFAPIKTAHNMGAFLLTNHHIERSEKVEELVELGPKALPYLLRSLDDQTPTKLVIKHEFGIGAMWYSNELTGNPANLNEQRALSGLKTKDPDSSGKSVLSSHTVSVGEVCFVIIGQIVGRPYQAVHYQPTACIVVNSPVHDSDLAKRVRHIWTNKNPEQNLLDSLLLDFSSNDGWVISSAMRMVYYYPRQTTNLIASRLMKLDVGTYSQRRDKSNGVRADDLIKAVSWSEEPSIQAALLKIVKTTADPQILEAACARIDSANANVIRLRLEEFISNLPVTEGGPFGDGYHLLTILGRQFGAKARPDFARYLKDASLQRKRTMCHVVADARLDWAAELLIPLLNDTSPLNGWTYPVTPGQNEPRLPIRICDEAADAISKNSPQPSFKLEGDHANLDRQIEKMRERH